jgi:LPS-assembly protein
LPDVDQDDLPQLDDIDSIDNIHLVTYGIDNYLNKFINSGGLSENFITFAELKIEQSYDLRGDSSDEPFSDIFSELKWNLLSGAYLSYKNYYDVYENTFNRHIFAGHLSNSRGDYVSLDYSFNKSADIEQINGDDIEQINAYFLTRILNNWSVGGTLEHSISQDETIEARGSLIYHADCWSVKFETRYTPEDTSFLVVFSLANIGLPLGVNF